MESKRKKLAGAAALSVVAVASMMGVKSAEAACELQDCPPVTGAANVGFLKANTAFSKVAFLKLQSALPESQFQKLYESLHFKKFGSAD